MERVKGVEVYKALFSSIAPSLQLFQDWRSPDNLLKSPLVSRESEQQWSVCCFLSFNGFNNAPKLFPKENYLKS